MSRMRATDPVRVPLGACECPGTPHEEDEAWLRPRLKPEAAIAVLSILGDDDLTDHVADLGSAIGMAFLRGGLLRWNILDDAGEPIPLSAIEDDSLDWDTTIRPIAEAATETYVGQLMRPLVPTASKSSKRGQTASSTSAKSKRS